MEGGKSFVLGLTMGLSDVIFLLLQALRSVVLFVLLAPYDHEQSDLMHRVYEEKKLEHLPKYKYVVMVVERILNVCFLITSY